MANIIKIKNSSVAAKVPATSDLAYGEIALNYADGKIYYKKSDNTIQSISGGVASVSGTAPIVSSGGATPAISIPVATTSVSGYLSSTDWNTFNNKQAALGFTPYNATNPSGYISSITSGNVTTALGFTPENSANKGAANGYAPLDATSKISSTYLPSYVDDVLEYTNLAGFPATGTTGLIYVALDTNKIYRWSGSAYIEISGSPGSTDAVTEGTTNKYYTDTRARAAISATQNITYNSSTGVITGPVLSGYAPLASPTFTGTVTAPTFSGNLSGSATSLNGYVQSTSSTANTIPLRDSNGYLSNNYFYTSSGGSERNTSGMGYFAGFNSGDYYIRSYTPAAVAAAISGQAMNIAGNATSSTYTAALRQSDGTTFLTPASNIATGGSRAADLAPNTYNQGLFSEFKNSSLYSFTGNYTGLLTYAPWSGTTASTGDSSYQLAFSPSAANSTTNPSFKIRAGIDTTWGSWNTIWHSGNLTNLNQLTNGPGYITSYTETDTLATVTARGATTTVAPTFSGGATVGAQLNVQYPSASISGYYTGVRETLQNTSNTVGNFSTLSFVTSAGNDAAAIWTVYNAHTVNAASGDLIFGTSNSAAAATERIRISAAGNVGIGQTNPAYKLDVQGTGVLGRFYASSGGYSGINISDNTSSGGIGLLSNGNDLSVQLGGAEKLRITSAGAATLTGTISPSDALSYLTTANTYPTTRPSLNLDFANSATLDPRITFTRGTNATYTGSDGLVKNTAGIHSPRFDWDPVTRECKGLLIEEARTNLLTYSEDSSIYHWLDNASIVINQTVSPNGNTNANKIVSTLTGGSNTCYVQKTSTVASDTQTYTFSIFVKAGTSPTTTLNLSLSGGTYQQVVGIVTWATNTFTTGTLINYGNGWYKASITLTNNATNTVLTGRIYVKDQSTANVSGEYGYLWGWQIEAGAFATSYIPSSVTWTGRASTATYVGSNGLIQTAASGVARYQYNPTNLSVAPFLLLEPAATNLFPYSESLAGGSGGGTRNLDAGIIDPAGNTNTVYYCTTSEWTTVFNGGSATTISVSFFAKLRTGSGVDYIRLEMFQSVTGTVVNIGTYDFYLSATNADSGYFKNITRTAYPNGWYRFTCNVVANTSAAAGYNYFTVASRLDIEGGISSNYIWGIQVETGSVATSYIPTVASQVTRIADTSTSAQTTRSVDVATMTNSNFSSWYNFTEGTFIAEAETYGTTSYPGVYKLDDNGLTLNMVGAYFSPTSGDVGTFWRNAWPTFVQYGANKTLTPQYKVFVKMGFALKTGQFAATINGQAPAVSAEGVLPTNHTKFTIGCADVLLNGHIKRLTYYPTRLSNSTLQALTT